MGWAEKVLEIVSCGKLCSRWLLLGLWRCDLWRAPHAFDLPDPMDCALFFFSLACLTRVWTRVSSSSQFAWDFPSFKTESPMSWAAPSPSKLAQLVTLISTHLRPRRACPSLLSLGQVDLTSGSWQPQRVLLVGDSRATGYWGCPCNSHFLLVP